ncbi:MAG: LysR family transcriptional regulator [Bacteroidales bacterium]|nr:LysR family transcriptional regulator [Bacteroidales bacterium]
MEYSSFTAAASSLGLTQPAVSQSIAELEKTLGVQLFERSRGEVRLTPKGELFMGYARQIMHWYNVANESLNPSSADGPLSPARVSIDPSTDAEIWSSRGDLHIEIVHK